MKSYDLRPGEKVTLQNGAVRIEALFRFRTTSRAYFEKLVTSGPLFVWFVLGSLGEIHDESGIEWSIVPHRFVDEHSRQVSLESVHPSGWKKSHPEGTW